MPSGRFILTDTPVGVYFRVMNSSANRGDSLWLTMGWLRRRVRFSVLSSMSVISPTVCRVVSSITVESDRVRRRKGHCRLRQYHLLHDIVEVAPTMDGW